MKKNTANSTGARSNSGGSQSGYSSGGLDMISTTSFVSCSNTQRSIVEEMNIKANEHI